MRNKITEKICLWDNLQKLSETKPIILYGMGNGADKILNLCDKKNIKINAVFASDEFVRGQYFRGYKVEKLREIEEKHKDFCILTAFASRENEIIDRIYKLNEKYELYAPNFPVFGEDYFDVDFLSGNIKDIENAYFLLSQTDKISQKTYIDTINFILSGKLKYLRNICTEKSEALDLLDLQSELYYIDVGAYNGDTIFELTDYLKIKNKNIRKITAFEPDKKNYAKLEKNIAESDILNKCELYNIAAWSEEKKIYFESKSGRNSSVNNPKSLKFTEINANSLDNILNQNDLNGEILIKYDVEGAEYEALLGSSETIKKYSPKLIVSLYHRNEDIFKLLLLINKINPNYDFYLRKHKYIPCWDLNLYAIPKKMKIFKNNC